MRQLILLAFGITLVGCQSIGVPFLAARPDYSEVPVETLREVARDIERIVADEQREFTLADRSGIVVSAEDVRHAIRTRAARHELLTMLLDSGHAWERRHGHVWIIRTREYRRFGTSRDRDRHALTVDGESADRWTIYEGIVRDSNLSPKALPAVQRIFFEERVKLMAPGQKYETESGDVAFIGGAPIALEAPAAE